MKCLLLIPIRSKTECLIHKYLSVAHVITLINSSVVENMVSCEDPSRSEYVRWEGAGEGGLRGRRSEAADRAEAEICSRSLSTMLFLNIS